LTAEIRTANSEQVSKHIFSDNANLKAFKYQLQHVV